MKNLFFKELKLAMHPICYVFIFAFPLMILIPNYPSSVAFIYVLSGYPILFLGANKGQQSNDLIYTTLLPVRKKDVVLARIFAVLFMQLTSIVICSILVPIAIMNQSTMDPKNLSDVGFALKDFPLTVAFTLVGFAITDIIYFSIYYKNGKSIFLSSLLSIIGFIVFIGIFTIGLPLVDGYNKALTGSGYLLEFIILFVAILISFVLHFFTYKIASNYLEKVDL